MTESIVEGELFLAFFGHEVSARTIKEEAKKYGLYRTKARRVLGGNCSARIRSDNIDWCLVGSESQMIERNLYYRPVPPEGTTGPIIPPP